MAKTSSIEKDKKRRRLIEKYAKKRAELKAILKNPKTQDTDFYAAQRELTMLPRNSSPVRARNRCKETGRPRGYLRRFGLSRLTFREIASRGEAPGVTKSSW